LEKSLNIARHSLLFRAVREGGRGFCLVPIASLPDSYARAKTAARQARQVVRTVIVEEFLANITLAHPIP
jgi:hypothetical protein